MGYANCHQAARPKHQFMPVEQQSKDVPSEMSAGEFEDAFGGLYEHSAWAATRTFDSCVSQQWDSVDGLCVALRAILEKADHDEKLALIQAHPDLAGKAAAAGTLTDESNIEQSSAGLDQCSSDELERFHSSNNAYKLKFEFPLIMAVKNSNRHLIPAAFEQRINNTKVDEFVTAIGEINKLARLRLNPFFTTE